METNENRNTNFFDVIIALFNFVANLISPKKAIAICVLYMTVIQNLILLFKSGTYEQASSYSYKDTAVAVLTSFMKGQLPIVIVVLGAIIVFLIIAIIALILYNGTLRKEIKRLAGERSSLMHDSGKIKTHRSSCEGV